MRKIAEIIWVTSYVWKILRKHAVTTGEIVRIFHNQPVFQRIERGRIQGEDLYVAAGQTDGGRYLMVFFILKTGGEAMPISARAMTHREKQRYGKQR